MKMFNTIPNNPFPPSSETAGGGGIKPYELPVASSSELGGVKVGVGLSIDSGGVLSKASGSVTTLYDGDGISQASYTLIDSIDNFDLIGVRFLRTNNIEVFNLYSPSYLNELITNGHSTGVATNDKWCFFKVYDKTTFTRYDESDLHIVNVYGIKL